jgi:hypothetical protein
MERCKPVACSAFASFPRFYRKNPDLVLVDTQVMASVYGDFLRELGRADEARGEFERAASLTRNSRELLLERASVRPKGLIAARTKVTKALRFAIIRKCPSCGTARVIGRYSGRLSRVLSFPEPPRAAPTAVGRN